MRRLIHRYQVFLETRRLPSARIQSAAHGGAAVDSEGRRTPVAAATVTERRNSLPAHATALPYAGFFYPLNASRIIRVIRLGRSKKRPARDGTGRGEQRQAPNLLASPAFVPLCGRASKHGPRIRDSVRRGSSGLFFTRDAAPVAAARSATPGSGGWRPATARWPRSSPAGAAH